MPRWCNSFSRPPEPQPLTDVLRKDPWQALLHGGPLRRSHENMDGRDRDGSRGLHAVHELRWRTIGARWCRLQNSRLFGRDTSNDLDLLFSTRGKNFLLLLPFLFSEDVVYLHGCAEAHPPEVFCICLDSKREPEDEKTEWAEPAGGGAVAIDENAFLPSEISFSCSFCCLDFYLWSKWFVFPHTSWGKMPNDIMPFWNCVESTDMKWRTGIYCRRLC